MTTTTASARQLVTNAEARALGIKRAALNGKEWRLVFRGVRTPSGAPLDLLTRCRAALALHPDDAHLSHATAAELLGVPISPSDEVHVTVHERRHRYYRPGLRPHLRVRASECHVVRGLPCSAPLQLFVELAGCRSLVDAVIAGDHLVRRKWVTREELLVYTESLTGKHSRKARRAARLVRDDVDSPMETRVRLLLVFSGLPEPAINHRVRAGDGTVLRRFELCYEPQRLIIEYDERHHVERIEQWEDDLDRREEIDDNEWRILVIVSSGIFREPERTIRRVRRALEGRGFKLPPVKDDWRPHFPGR